MQEYLLRKFLILKTAFKKKFLPSAHFVKESTMYSLFVDHSHQIKNMKMDGAMKLLLANVTHSLNLLNNMYSVIKEGCTCLHLGINLLEAF